MELYDYILSEHEVIFYGDDGPGYIWVYKSYIAVEHHLPDIGELLGKGLIRLEWGYNGELFVRILPCSAREVACNRGVVRQWFDTVRI